MNKSVRQNARLAALKVLDEVEERGAYSHLAVNNTLRQGQWPEQEAGLLTELVYGTIQRKNTLDYFIRKRVKQPLSKLQLWVLNLLRISFYQLHFLDRIPAHAIVNEAVTIAKKRGHKGISGMVNGVLRNAIREKDTFDWEAFSQPAEKIALIHSHPQWLVERWMDQYGETVTEAMCQANNQPPKSSIRVNLLRHSREEYLAQLIEQGIDAAPSALSRQGVVINRAGNLANRSGYREGNYSIQDESSMLVADILDPHPDMKVLDACAAPGGKTTHLAELMGDRGEIWANDIHSHKIHLIEEQLRRLQLSCIRTITGDALKLNDRFDVGSFDRILLDAPCSGLGVIRRKPDIKWSKKASDIDGISRLQVQLLSCMAPLLKSGGRMVYSTCTVEKSENEQVIEQFLAAHPQFALDQESPLLTNGMRQIYPQEYLSDGFFIAKLKKR